MGCAVPLAAALLAAAPVPGPSTFRNVADGAAPSLVHLVCGNGHMASGVIVGGSGQVLAPLTLCKAQVVVAVRGKGAPMNARRVKESAALGVMLLQLPEGSYPAAATGDASKLVQGSWVVAVAQTEKGPSASAGMASGRDPADPKHLFTDTPTLAGAGIFALDGRLVGIAVAPARAHRVKVAPVDALKAWLSGDAP